MSEAAVGSVVGDNEIGLSVGNGLLGADVTGLLDGIDVGLGDVDGLSLRARVGGEVAKSASM